MVRGDQVTMRDIVALEVRNIMFASGTLSPMTSWEAEMEIPFEVQLENKHVIGDQQLMAGAPSNSFRKT